METYQYYIDDIQSAVFSPETAEPDFLRDSAAQYAEACAEVNDRLREVARLLHRGLRSEALQLAEEEPNLLDTVASLDFPELPTWTELLIGWGMAPPPPLLIELAADINQAYADQQPLESLLKQHRLFALGRAPLAARIHILRQINKADADSATWEADLVSLEEARLKEIGGEAEAASRSKNLSDLAAIVAELSDKQWTVTTPTSLMTRVNGLHEKLAGKLALDELTSVEVNLNAAHMALDIDAAREVRSRWEELAQTAKLLPNNPLAQQAVPALEWIAGQDRRDEVQVKRTTAIGALQEALEDEVPIEDLERLYQATLLFDDPIEPQLKSRVDQRLHVLALGAKRKHRILLTAIVSAVLMVGGLVVWVIFLQSHNQTVAQTVDSLQELISQNSYEGAQQFYEEVATSAPKVAGSPKVQEQKAKLDEAIAKEMSRANSFAQNMSRAEQTGPKSPDRIALAEAKKIAVLPDEKARVAEMESEIAAVLHDVQLEQDSLLAGKINSFLERIKGLETQANEGLEVQEAMLIALRRTMESAKKELPVASAAMRAQLEPLLGRIDAIRKIRKARAVITASRDKITAAVGNVASFRSALEEFATAHPESSLARNMPQLRKDSSLWEGVVQWGQLSVPVPAAGASDISAEQATDFLKRGRELQGKFGNIPLDKSFQQLESPMEPIANRVTEDGSTILSGVKELLQDHLIRRLWMLEDNKGLRYYCRKKPESGKNSVRFKYVAGFDLVEKTGTVRSIDIKYNGLAPQSIASQKCLQWIDQIESKGWERTFTGIVKTIVDQEEIDPILKIVLLKRILEAAASGSYPMEEAFGDYRNRLDAADVDLSVPWMDPRNQSVLAERGRAEFLLGSLPDLKDIILNTASRLKSVRQESVDGIRWIGWLHRHSLGDWQMLGQEEGLTDGDLVVIDMQEGSSGATFHVVGKTKDNKTELSASNPTMLIEGRPVFLRNHH